MILAKYMVGSITSSHASCAIKYLAFQSWGRNLCITVAKRACSACPFYGSNIRQALVIYVIKT